MKRNSVSSRPDVRFIWVSVVVLVCLTHGYVCAEDEKSKLDVASARSEGEGKLNGNFHSRTENHNVGK